MTAASEEAGSAFALVEKAKELVRRFLELTDPSSVPTSSTDASELPISKWDILYSTQQAGHVSDAITPSIIVRSHPSPQKHFFSVQSVLPDIDARQFWALMANSDNRSLWDSTIESSSVHSWLTDVITKDCTLSAKERAECEKVARKLSARVELLQFGSIMFVASKRDMVLLSVDAQLPSADGLLRLISTSASIEMPSTPLKKGYNRFHLEIGGFLVEDLSYSSKGIRVTQISDLGEMASWIPASIIKMVASTMVPKSLNVISKVAFKMKVPKALLIQGCGYGGEQEEDHVERNLCESGGGSWQTQRHLAPLWSESDLLLNEEDGEADMAIAAEEHLRRPQLQLKAESDGVPPKEAIKLLSEQTDAVLGEDSPPVLNHSDQNSDTTIAKGATSKFAFVNAEQDRLDSTVLTEAQDGQLEDLKDESQKLLPLEDLVDRDDDVGNDSLASLFSAEDTKDCTQILTRHSDTIRRMSPEQRANQRRISLLLVSGSDSLAMAIAPGARESMKEVARLMNFNTGSLENESIQSLSGKGSPRLRLVTATSSDPVPPFTSTMNVERIINSSDTIDSSSSSATLCEEERASFAAAWTSSLTVVPYIMAIGISNLASWIATRPQTSSIDVEVQVQKSISEAETSRPVLSALGVTRQVYLQRDAVRIIRPQSQYRMDDVKLHPFPLINDENLPPLGIATGQPAATMHCDQAKEASLHQETVLRQGWWASYT